MKKLSSWLILFTLLFSLCSCSQEHINDINSGEDRQAIEVTLNAAEHTELNFGYTNGERAIRDFAADNAKIYILQYDSSILIYDRNGKFIEKYDLNLAEQGLTARSNFIRFSPSFRFVFYLIFKLLKIYF